MLLYSQKQWKLFLESATDVLFGHIPMVFEDYMQKSKLCVVYSDIHFVIEREFTVAVMLSLSN